jgi:hypothetical protein
MVLMACASANAEEGPPADVRLTLAQELSFGAMVRVKGRDPGLIGGGNGGRGTSINFDDGNLDYGRGFTALGVQGRTTLDAKANSVEARVEAVYFYDFLNAGGKTAFRALSRESRERAGRDIYLDDAYVGMNGVASGTTFNARLGNQILAWSDSPGFGYAIAPVNPISASRRYQPGNKSSDAYVALPMLTVRIGTPAIAISGFYQFGFRPTEVEAAGTFLSANDYYSPGGRFIQLGQGSPLVPDSGLSVVTPVTPFGSKVPRAPDRRPSSAGQFGVRVESREVGEQALVLAGYAMQVHTREPIVSVHTGTLGGLQHVTAPDYTSSGDYFVEYVPHLTVVGAAARLKPTAHTRLAIDYSMRFHQPLQIDDDILIIAGLAPAAALAACSADPSSSTCRATLAALNGNPVISARGGMTAANAARLLATELSGYQRFNLSECAISLSQGLPPPWTATQWIGSAEVGGIYIHGFRDRFLDASASVRPDDSGAKRLGFASRSAWGYRLSTKMEFPNVARLESVAPSVTWIHDVRGNAPITIGTFLEKNRSLIPAVDFGIDQSLSARLSYRSYLGKGSNADRFTDRDFVAFSLTKRF